MKTWRRDKIKKFLWPCFTFLLNIKMIFVILNVVMVRDPVNASFRHPRLFLPSPSLKSPFLLHVAISSSHSTFSILFPFSILYISASAFALLDNAHHTGRSLSSFKHPGLLSIKSMKWNNKYFQQQNPPFLIFRYTSKCPCTSFCFQRKTLWNNPLSVNYVSDTQSGLNQGRLEMCSSVAMCNILQW